MAQGKLGDLRTGAKIVVTGGLGFVGSNLVSQLLRPQRFAPRTRRRGNLRGGNGGAAFWRPDRAQILIVDRESLGADPANVAHLAPEASEGRLKRLKLDARDAAALADALLEFDPDCVFHLAAESHVDRSLADPAGFVDNNVMGTLGVLEACRRLQGRKTAQGAPFALISVSTDEVYGDNRPVFAGRGAAPAGGSAEARLFDERCPLLPSNPYAASKAAQDCLALSYARSFGLPVLVSRASNTYGRGQWPEKFLPKLIAAALTGLRFPLYGGGRAKRRWLHAADHARALIALWEKGRPGEIYNIAGGEPIANVEFARQALGKLALCLKMGAGGSGAPGGCESRRAQDGERERILSRIRSEAVLDPTAADRPGHDDDYAMSDDKIRLGACGESEENGEPIWTPAVDFEAGLLDAVWAAANRLRPDLIPPAPARPVLSSAACARSAPTTRI